MALQTILNLRKERTDEILCMYLMGTSVWEIADYFNMGDNEINQVIDVYAPYL
jgi:hypothetical protein